MEQNQDQEYIEREHCLILEHRRSLKITGVTDVIAYDEHIIQINTTDKALEIRGDGLHMKQLALDKGIIEVDGCVNSLEYQEQKVGCYPLLRLKLLEILLLTLRGMIELEIDRPYSTSVQEVLEYVNGNYQDSLTLGTFCEQKHYSVAYISRRFKQETGVTLREYVQNVRIEKSCELLEDSDLRVVEIARRVGYEDIKFFNQIFKRRMQVSPREYRKICMNRAADG